ncbi:hypothetical protein ACV8TG_04585 [Citrobacter freundii]|nr:hypothetical protein [Citrobacter freundii]MDE9727306.1 hypothetical protein [Citrobacter freundii]
MPKSQQDRPSDDDNLYKIELIKWHQRIQEISYIEAGLHMRALNQLMWQVPSLVIVINGGLWYGATLVSELAARLIFIMIMLFDLLSIVTLYRLRGLLSHKIKYQNNVESQFSPYILKKLNKEFYPKDFSSQEWKLRIEKIKIKPKPSVLSRFFKCCFDKINTQSQGDYTVIGCWSTVLFFCAVINIVGAATPSSFLDKQEKSQRYEIKNVKTDDTLTIEKK